MRAAASSIARGNPSSLTHISATAGALSLVTAKSGFAACARSMNSRTASYWVSFSNGGRLAGSGSCQGRDGEDILSTTGAGSPGW